jgi:Calcineurin-like phosphoesterase
MKLSSNKRALIAIVALALIWVEGASDARGDTGGGKPREKDASQLKQSDRARSWTFAVSGDSRNCGDVVMPAIAAGVSQAKAAFYWHLGDFRKITGIDEDIAQQPEHRPTPLTVAQYEEIAWKDFSNSQIKPFGKLPVYLVIGNHETAPPKTRDEYSVEFAYWLNLPNVRAQRLRDDPKATVPKTYYHWIQGGVDFIALDNATVDEFDPQQLDWIEQRLQADASNDAIRTVVIGMHEALPESISSNHSMDASPAGVASGRQVYGELLKLQNEGHKRVYVLASHSHYFMDGTFNTEYWREHGGVLPGWIIGTAGAQRYPLPPEAKDARAAETKVYGFLTGSVQPDGSIQFDFHKLAESDIPPGVVQRYTRNFVNWCFEQNATTQAPTH